MPLAARTRVGPYEVLAALGSGGMGEVYRARDTRLGREVALKVLKPGGRNALLQEARAASALNHPNIVALHDVCSENGTEFLVMELVRGKTLDQLIGKHGLPVSTALQYAIPIADALARAHGAGILHRDLKPSNIMITDEGVPKILDFGLAEMAEAESDLTRSLTDERHVAGTAAYMSPEQAEGKKLDARSDIFSFGAVLYEMVTGRRAFRGDSTASTLAAVLRHEPEPPQVPRDLERIIQRCLRKDPSRRFHSMNDVKVELEEVREESESGMQPVRTPMRRRRGAWVYAGLGVLLLAAAFWFWSSRTAPLPPSRPIPLTAYEGDELWPDFSPDGNQVVFAWDGGPDGKFHLYVKLVGASNHLQLTSGDGDEMFPAWSPDGRWIAFQRWDRTGSHTMLISPLGGPERKVGDDLCDARLPLVPLPQLAAFRLSWANDSQQLVCSSPAGGIVAVPALGGERRSLTFPPKGQRDVFPAFSSDGRNLVFERTVTLPFDCDVYGLSLNADLSPRGQPRRITNKHAWLGGLTWTVDGQDAIWGTVHPSQLYRVPVLRTGKIEPLGFDEVIYPVISRRQDRLAYVRWIEDADIWRSDGRTIERHPVSSTESDAFTHFSPDGKRIVFASWRSGALEIWVANADGTQAVPLTSSGKISNWPQWSPDGRWIVFTCVAADGSSDVWVVEANGGTPRRLTSDPGSSVAPSFSHDGKGVYFCARTGRPEIFRVPFAGGTAIRVTRSGGEFSQESPDGRTLYYTKDHLLFRMPVTGGPEESLGLHVIQDDFEIMRDGIYYVAQMHGNGFRGGELRFYDFATKRERVIQRLGDVLFLFGLSVSPDRKTFLYSAQQGTSADLMLVERFR